MAALLKPSTEMCPSPGHSRSSAEGQQRASHSLCELGTTRSRPLCTKRIGAITRARRSFLLDLPVGTHGWQAFAWCVGILVVFIPLSVFLYRRVAAC
jgi:hypothetical protein